MFAKPLRWAKNFSGNSPVLFIFCSISLCWVEAILDYVHICQHLSLQRHDWLVYWDHRESLVGLGSPPFQFLPGHCPPSPSHLPNEAKNESLPHRWMLITVCTVLWDPQMKAAIKTTTKKYYYIENGCRLSFSSGNRSSKNVESWDAGWPNITLVIINLSLSFNIVTCFL